MPRANKLGHPGISLITKTGKYQVFHRGKYVGVFDELEQAVAALKAAIALLGKAPSKGRPKGKRFDTSIDREVIPKSFKRKKKHCSKCQREFLTTPRRRMLCPECFKYGGQGDCTLGYEA